MPSHSWDGFRQVTDLTKEFGNSAIAEKVDAILSGVMESIADSLSTATPDMLRAGAVAARETLESFERTHEVDEHSPSFVAGRLASAIDVLGYASYQTADESILELARTQPYGSLLVALADGPMRSVDLADKLKKDEARTSKWLATLREKGAVSSHRHGRELVSALTPVGRLVVETGWQDERRASLDSSNVVSLSASRYDMGAKTAPLDVEVREIPRISASGG